MKKKLTIVFVALSIFAFSNSFANSYITSDIFKTSLGGAAIGAVAGTAVAALIDDFSEHTDYIIKGAAIGAITGICYAIFNASQSYQPVALVEKDKNNNLRFGFPPVRVMPNDKYEADLFALRF